RAGEVRAIARERSANQILVDLLNAETGSRGYALTGNPIYLDPYTNARARYQSDFAALQAQLTDEPTLQQAARTTNAAAQLWFDESTNLVRLRRQGRFQEAIARINAGIAKARIDAFRSAQGRLLAEIERLRVESLSRADRRRTITLVLVALAAALAMLAVGLVSRQLWRRVGGPLALLAAGVRRVARGELSEPVPASENAVRELSILTRSFNEMPDRVVEERENVAAAARREAAQQVERRLFETVQHGLLPARLPAPTGFRVAARYLPAEQGLLIGGDFYDAMLLGDGRLAMVVGDVAGHGAAAAARAAGLRFAWRTLVEVSPWPQAVLAGLNSQIGGAEDRAEGRFA